SRKQGNVGDSNAITDSFIAYNGK
ncbi:jg20677, partial [Pararge aegeria aegeria]